MLCTKLGPSLRHETLMNDVFDFITQIFACITDREVRSPISRTGYWSHERHRSWEFDEELGSASQ